MIKKILNIIKKEIITFKWFYISLILITLLFVIELDYAIESPGGLMDLKDKVNVENSYEENGSFNLTYVTSRPGTIVNIILSYIIPSWDLSSLDDMRYENESEDEIIKRYELLLREASYDAIEAAFKEANINYEVINSNIIVTHVYDEAKTDLKVGDIIKSINGNSINTYEELHNEIIKHKENEEIEISVLRNDKVVTCKSKLISSLDRVLIGITYTEVKNIKTDPKVTYIFDKKEGGSSRGLMCALEIYNRITEYDLTKGLVIAGTGTINSDGVVGAIAGVKYKLIGAVKKGAKIFIVPSDNLEEALKVKKENNFDIDIIEADNLHNVIEKLKNY